MVTLAPKNMKQNLGTSFGLGTASAFGLWSLLALSGCSGSGSGTASFVPIATAHSSASSSPVVVEGKLLVYLASEALSGAGGTNFNPGDADFADDCAVVVDMVARTETDLNVDALEVKILGDNVYLRVSESEDSFDWSGANGATETVLLHFSSTSPLSFVSELAPGTQSLGIAGGRLYFVRGDTTGVVNGETSLAFLTTAAPTVPVTVLSTDAGNTLFPKIHAIDQGLIFLTASEVVEGRVLNGDGDSTDTFVLALLDGTDIAGVVQVVGLSLATSSSPVRARTRGVNDWVIGFLVDEATQDNFVTGLNDPVAMGFSNAWKPQNCGSYADVDRIDQVLHVLGFAPWLVNPIASPPQNTGIPGTGRVLCTANSAGTLFSVATLVREADDGGCNLNNDNNTTDTILRWVKFAAPQLPFGTISQLNAVEETLPGGANAISDLAGRFVCVVSEVKDNTDHDGGGLTHDLVAWIDPNAALPVWVFDHNPNTAGIQSVGASALSDRIERDRLLVAFQESVFGASVNSGGDNDTLDSSPTFARFDPSNANDLDFNGPAVAIDPTNPGIVIANGFAFYRVKEADDSRDWNGDSVLDDFVIFRTNVSTNVSALLGSGARSTANDLQGNVIFTSGTIGAAYLANEGMAGIDLNQPADGRADGFVITWFRIG